MTPSLHFTPFDREMMQHCLQLARKALGKTAPNPLVGAVIVKEGKIIGEGFHPYAGQPHAEIFALRDAQSRGESVEGATVYVNLEPCNHYGRTPPCALALVEAQVGKVVVGMVDPNPLVAGGGIKRLEAAGIEVIVGVEEEDCQQLNEAFIHRIRYKRPFGILKYAMTLDGKIATSTGNSKWVTSSNARHQVHQLRSICDAVIVGGNTVRKDNPYLTSHFVSDRNPLRVVMSRSFDLPLECNLWDVSVANTLVITQENPHLTRQQQLRDQGVEIVVLEHLTPSHVMEILFDRGVSTVLWECGRILSAKAIQDQAVQKIMAFIAPKIIGGQQSPSPIGDLGLLEMSSALTLERVKWYALETDFLIEGYLPLSNDCI